MQAVLKLLGLAVLEILAGPFFFFAASFFLSLFGVSIEENFYVYLALTAVPVMLLGSLLAHFWGLWRANLCVRAATAVTCLLVPAVLNIPVYGLLALSIK